MPETTTFSTWLKAELYNRRMNAAELAGKAGISRAAAYFYVSGDRTPRPDVQAKIAGALGISLDQLPVTKV